MRWYVALRRKGAGAQACFGRSMAAGAVFRARSRRLSASGSRKVRRVRKAKNEAAELRARVRMVRRLHDEGGCHFPAC